MKNPRARFTIMMLVGALLAVFVVPVMAQNGPERPEVPFEDQCVEVKFDPADYESPDPTYMLNFFKAVSISDSIDVYQSANYLPGSPPADEPREMYEYLYFPAHVNFLQVFATIRSREDRMYFDLNLSKNGIEGGLSEIEVLPDYDTVTFQGYIFSDTEIQDLTTGFGSTKFLLKAYTDDYPVPSTQYLQVKVFGVYYCYTPAWEYFWKVFLPNMFRRY